MPDDNAIERPIINSPFCEPARHWEIRANEPARLVSRRRKASYFYLPPNARPDEDGAGRSLEIEIHKINTIRERLAEWRPLAMRGEGGATRVTAELLNYWRRDGREQRLFFAQLEAAETIIFLNEARADFLQGINIPADEPGAEKQRDGYTAPLRRLCCKMATGGGKTTVMAMIAAWSILNKTADKRDKRYSDAVLVVCPNVTIRDRLAELDPQKGEASIYRARDLVPQPRMKDLKQGKVLTVNWHVFEPRTSSAAKVMKTGRRRRVSEKVFIGDKTQTLRGKRYMTEKDLREKAALGLLTITEEYPDKSGRLKSADIASDKYVETDSALTRRVLARELDEKKNILVLNDEAHHAYRLRAGDNAAGELLDDEEETGYYYKEATVWIDGLDKVNKTRGINFCADFSATPYFLGSAGKDTNRVFPWTVSDFGLHDAIESGLVKIPQLAVRDPSGNTVPGYFNIWRWILPQMTDSERGGRKSEAKPSAVLKYAHTPLAMLGGMWETMRREWAKNGEARPPVFIIVCKTTKLAQVVYDWLANDMPPTPEIPKAGLPALVNDGDSINTVRIDSKVQQEIDGGNAKSDEARWQRYLLDTIGKTQWPRDRQGRSLYPDGFEALAKKLGRARFLAYPPGRDIRCIVSVSMLTEGWDCSTVTHIIGLRPFMSQLLCEQVIGRGLRRASYETDEDGLMREELAHVFGVPLAIYPIKASPEADGAPPPPVTKYRIYAVPQKEEEYGIKFPRVEGYHRLIRRRLLCDVDKLPKTKLQSDRIPPEVEMAAALPDNEGRVRLGAPGGVSKASLDGFRGEMRLQQRVFEMTEALLKHYAAGGDAVLPRNMLFAQLYKIVSDYIARRVARGAGADKRDAFMSPYYGYIISLLKDIAPAGDGGELPRYENERGAGATADVDFFTRRKPYEIKKSHINALVPDTERLEQSVAYRLDNNRHVKSFVKNEGLGFAIPYAHEGKARDYMPDFIVRLDNGDMLILETKGYDPREEAKAAAARRWVSAVNAGGEYGRWHYDIIRKNDETDGAIAKVIKGADGRGG